MKVSQIKIQQNLLTLNARKSCAQIERQINGRNKSSITQISLFNSNIDSHIFPSLPANIEMLVIRKCEVSLSASFQVNAECLRVLELPYCRLKSTPRVCSQVLHKLNVSHNNISQVLEIPNRCGLRLLDLRDNRIQVISLSILSLPQMTIQHQFIPHRSQNCDQSSPYGERRIVRVAQMIAASISGWGNARIIQICEDVIENNNERLLGELLPFLNDVFVSKIFEIAKTKRKHNVLELLVGREEIASKLELADRLMLLMPGLLPIERLRMASLQDIVKCLSESSNETHRVRAFLEHVQLLSQGENLFLQSQKDLISYMNLNLKYSNSFQVDFILSQITFFRDYDFSNISIIKYLLNYDNLPLTRFLLSSPLFNERLFTLSLFTRLVKPSKKIYKILKKRDREYRKEWRHKSSWYFPEYRERKSFCLKNDLFDYQILREYEEMQGSYFKKDLRFTLKFCNKENQMSVAKRIGNELKKESYQMIKGKITNLSMSKQQCRSNSSTLSTSVV